MFSSGDTGECASLSFSKRSCLLAPHSLLTEKRVGRTTGPRRALCAVALHGTDLSLAAVRLAPRWCPSRKGTAVPHQCAASGTQGTVSLHCISFFIWPDVRQHLQLSELCRAVVVGCRHRSDGSCCSCGVRGICVFVEHTKCVEN